MHYYWSGILKKDCILQLPCFFLIFWISWAERETSRARWYQITTFCVVALHNNPFIPYPIIISCYVLCPFFTLTLLTWLYHHLRSVSQFYKTKYVRKGSSSSGQTISVQGHYAKKKFCKQSYIFFHLNQILFYHTH